MHHRVKTICKSLLACSICKHVKPIPKWLLPLPNVKHGCAPWLWFTSFVRIRKHGRGRFRLYLSQLATLSRASYAADHSSITIDFLPPQTGIKRCPTSDPLRTHCLVSELILNAYKHAYRDNQHGRITVALQNLNKHCFQLSVSDDGCGLQIILVGRAVQA